MGNVIISQGAKSVGFLTRLRQIFFWGSFVLVFLLVFYQSISESIETKSFMPIVNSLGSRFLLATQDLQTASDDIILKQGVYIEGDTWWSNLKNFFLTFADLYTALFIVYVWMKLLMWLYSKTPLSEEGKWFVNFLLAIGTFTVLQIIFLISAGAINKTIESAGDVARLTAIPFIAYWTFIKAIPYMLSPALDTIGKFVDKNSTGIINGTTDIT